MNSDHPSNSTQSLRIAVIAEGTTMPRWFHNALGSACGLPGTLLTGWFQIKTADATSTVESLFGFFDQLDAHILCRNSSAFEQLCIAESLGAPALGKILLDHKGEASLPHLESLQALIDLDLDVLLCCSSRRLTFPKAIARHGAWAIEIGYGVSALATWAGAAEVAGGSDVTVARVVDYASPETPELYCSVGATIHSSVRRNRLRVISKCQTFFKRLLADLLSCAQQKVIPRILPVPATYPRQKGPSINLLLNALQRMLRSVARNRLGLGDAGDCWHIAYSFTDDALPTIPYSQLHYLKPPAGFFWADPFPLQYQGQYYILFEELAYATQRGRLLAVKVSETLEASPPILVLENEHHLSYPFVFYWQEQLYMVPETSSQDRVELLRCVEFPGRWEVCKVMLNHIRAVDASLWEQDGTWWMFVNVAPEGADLCDELHLYFSDSPLGDWKPHPYNPICSDIRCARPAGPLFETGGQLFRPSQDSAKRYGHSLWINRVEQLDQTCYRESSAQRIEPDWRNDITRIHTLARAGRLTVIDCSLEREGHAFFSKIARSLPNSVFNKKVTKLTPVTLRN